MKSPTGVAVKNLRIKYIIHYLCDFSLLRLGDVYDVDIYRKT